MYFAPSEELVEAQPTQFVGHLLWGHSHSHLLWAQGVGVEAEREGGTLLADSHPPLISTCNESSINSFKTVFKSFVLSSGIALNWLGTKTV